MAVTRLKRKHRKNIARANNRQRVIKQLLSTPVIKNVDLEELKAQFGKTSDATATTTTPTTTASTATTTASAETEGGVVNTVREAITGVAQTVVDTVKDVLGKDEKKSAE